MDWTSADLAAFNIIVQDQDQDSFFDGPLPDYSGFPGFLETEDVIIPKEFSLSLATDVKQARDERTLSLWLQNGHSIHFWQVC
jgi:hypothetical protein